MNIGFSEAPANGVRSDANGPTRTHALIPFTLFVTAVAAEATVLPGAQWREGERGRAIYPRGRQGSEPPTCAGAGGRPSSTPRRKGQTDAAHIANLCHS